MDRRLRSGAFRYILGKFERGATLLVSQCDSDKPGFGNNAVLLDNTGGHSVGAEQAADNRRDNESKSSTVFLFADGTSRERRRAHAGSRCEKRIPRQALDEERPE